MKDMYTALTLCLDRGMRNSKKSIMPSTAFAHDLTNAEPVMLEDDRMTRSTHSSARTGTSTPVILPGMPGNGIP